MDPAHREVNRMLRLRPLLPLAAALLAACGDNGPTVVDPGCGRGPAPSAAPAPPPASSPYDAVFARAGAEFGVPAALLRAIGYAETRWQMVRGAEEFPGMPAAYGVMALRGERLERGAALAGVTAEAARVDPEANVRAAAALLRAHADEQGVRGDQPDDWAPAVARFSGIASPEGRASYVQGAVLAALSGRTAPAARASRSAAADPCGTPTAPADGYAGAVQRPSPNQNERPAGETGRVQMVVVHSCEGGYAGCWSWLASPESGVSAHYVVREDGGEITQLVPGSKRAWHIAARYDCTLNGSHACGTLNGAQSNHFTVGVEHAGFASQTAWPAAQVDASARLVCDVTRRRAIPRDRFHVVSHAQLQPYNRTDPGAGWPWADYLARIAAHCAG
jgi:hypothetical protein